MQYSGIEDVYEQEIYAGDIVYQEFHDRISEQHGFTGVVVQRKELGGFVMERIMLKCYGVK